MARELRQVNPCERFEQKRPPEYILKSHGIIPITQWLRQTAEAGNTQAASLELQTSEGAMQMQLGLEGGDWVSLIRPNRVDNDGNATPVYGRVPDTDDLRVLVLEEGIFRKKRDARIVTLPQEYIASYDITQSHPTRKGKIQSKHIAGIQELSDELAKALTRKKRKEIKNRIRGILQSLTVEVVPRFTIPLREVAFGEMLPTGNVMFRSKAIATIPNPGKNISVRAINRIQV